MSSNLQWGSARYVPSSQNERIYQSNMQHGLYLLADLTGGRALFNSNDVSSLLEDVEAHQEVSYSLGFEPETVRRDRVRQVHVALAPGAARGRRLDYRRAFRDKTLEERLAESLLSTAWLGNVSNPLNAAVRFLPTTAIQRDIHELVVEVSVSEASIATLPGPATDSGQGSVRIWMLAVEQEEGHRTLVRQKTFPVGGEDGVAVQDGFVKVQIGMNLPEGDYQVAVGVRDETTAVTSRLREPVRVPWREP